MKNESSGKIMTEFIGLRSKIYAQRVLGGGIAKIKKTAKGITATT